MAPKQFALHADETIQTLSHTTPGRLARRDNVQSANVFCPFRSFKDNVLGLGGDKDPPAGPPRVSERLWIASEGLNNVFFSSHMQQ